MPSASGGAVDFASINSDLDPSTPNVFDIGKVGAEWRNAKIGNDLVVGGSLTVEGPITTIESVTLTVEDKNIELAFTPSPTDALADGGGIILKGNTDKTILWKDATDSWDFNQKLRSGNIELDGNTIRTTDVNGDLVLTPNGTGVVRLGMNLNTGGFSIISDTDVDIDIITGGTGVVNIGAMLAIGDAPSVSGGLGLTNGEAITARNNANTGDIVLLTSALLNSRDGIILGNTAGVDVMIQNQSADRLGFFGVTPSARAGVTDDIKDALTAYGLLQGAGATPLNLDGGALAAGQLNADNLRLDGNTLSTITGDLDITTQTGGVFKFTTNAFQSGQDASNYLEIGHGGSNSFINTVGAGGVDLRFGGTTKVAVTPAGHVHLLTDTDQKHTLKIKTADNLKETGIAWENSGGNFSQTIFRNNVGSNRSDLIFAIGSDPDIDQLTNSFKIHGSAAFEGRLEVLSAFQISSGNPGIGKVWTDAGAGDGIGTWTLPAGGGFTDAGATIILTNINDDVGIGTSSPNAKLDVGGNPGASVGGFPSGQLHVTGQSASVNGNAVITGHNLFGGNKQLWYLGSTSSSNDNIALINRQNAETHLHTNNASRFEVKANGDLRFNQYPNTRDDGTPINILGTDASGNLISGPNEVIHIGGNFTDTVDQSIVTASTPQSITFNQNRLINDISHTAGSDTFTVNTSGVYQLMIAPQLGQGSGAATVEFWVEKNGVNIVDSNIQLTIGANSQTLPFLRWKEQFVATDTFKIIWASNSVNTSLDNITSSFGGPNIPSIMLGVTHQGSLAA